MKTTNSLQKTAKFAGAAYFIIIITSVFSMAFGPYRLIVENDIKKTIEKWDIQYKLICNWSYFDTEEMNKGIMKLLRVRIPLEKYNGRCITGYNIII